MSFLTINAIPILLMDKKAEFDTEELGEQLRAVSGQLIGTRRALYRKWKFDCIPQAQVDADFVRNLVLGLGHHWNFDTDFYSSKGLGASSLTGNSIGTTTPSPKFGAGYANVTTVGANSLNFTGACYNRLAQNATRWTVIVWFYNGSSWDGYAIRSDGKKWVNGVENDAASTSWLVVNASGDIQLAGANKYDDLVALPYYARPSDLVAWTSATQPFSDLPRLFISGDIVGEPPNSAVALGIADPVKLQQGNLGAGFTDNVETFSFQLIET